VNHTNIWPVIALVVGAAGWGLWPFNIYPLRNTILNLERAVSVRRDIEFERGVCEELMVQIMRHTKT